MYIAFKVKCSRGHSGFVNVVYKLVPIFQITTPAIAGFSFTSTAMSSTRTGNYTALVDVLAAPLSKRGGSAERCVLIGVVLVLGESDSMLA